MNPADTKDHVKIVMMLNRTTKNTAIFVPVNEDDGTVPLYLTRDAWEALDSPVTVTVIVEPYGGS